jgi:hypothetical protein
MVVQWVGHWIEHRVDQQPAPPSVIVCAPACGIAAVVPRGDPERPAASAPGYWRTAPNQRNTREYQQHQVTAYRCRNQAFSTT